VIETQELVAFLDKIHLFSGLDLTQLAGVAARLTERAVSAGAAIIKKGDRADGFYMLFKGKAKVTLLDAERVERQLAVLYSGDYFGEEALFENRPRSANVIAMEDCVLLFISPPAFNSLMQQYEKLKPNFHVAIKSRKLARSTNFKWLGKNEIIYFIARRHKIRLFQALIAPTFSMIGALLLILFGVTLGSYIPQAVGVALVVFVFGWGVWNAVDWSNDYYIVTNQRVVWLEKVIGLHDSREEAPLGTILSVGVETDYLGRILDFGNVIVRTFVGKLEFDHVDHPVQAADMIREYWERTKAITNRTQMDVMKDTIKQKLGVPLEKRRQVELAPVIPVDEEKVLKTPLWLLALQNFVQLRIEEGGKIIYHKHWIILIRQAWKPFGLTVAGIMFLFWRIFLIATSELTFFHINAAGHRRPDFLTALVPLLMFPVGFWLWYQFTDWRNDTFMVTNDEIFDIDRKPFGTEEKRSAQIENILSTSYKRLGFIAYIFNYGTVYITVGGTQMAFEDVMDPAAVQADINRRRAARIAKKNEDAGKDDRERFANWIAAYHKNINEFNGVAAPPLPTNGVNPFTAAAKESKDLEDIPLGGEEGFGEDYSGEEGFEDGGGDYDGEYDGDL